MRVALGLVVLLGGLLVGCGPRGPQSSAIAPGPDAQHRVQTALIEARPGDVIQLAAGRFEFDGTLSLDVDGVTLRGQGPDQTVLSFQHQQPGTGGEGILVTSNQFLLEDLAIEDAVSDAVKVNGADGVTFRRVRITWTGEPKSTNGAYGLYPVLCSNVLIEHCQVSGASDAGIYVGQSRNIIVRHNRAARNVAGIEIENSIDADVYENDCTDNAGGILVFTLPELPRKEGRNCRVFHNRLVSNNHANFATPGGIVALVPPGTGMIVLANDDTEVFENRFENNQSVNLAVVSYEVTQLAYHDAQYDPYPEGISIHDNTFAGGGDKPGGMMGVMFGALLGGRVPDIVWDGAVDAKKLVEAPSPQPSPRRGEGVLPEAMQLRIADNGGATFADLDIQHLDPLSLVGLKPHAVRRDLQPFVGRHSPLPAVALSAPAEPPRQPVRREYPRLLSEHQLFQGNGSTQEPVKGVMPYDLNTPLFSDYTDKFRFIRLPRDASGQPIPARYSSTDAFDFPVGTIIAKTFAYPRDARRPELGHRLLETRLLIHEPEGWVGLPYVWNDEQTEAVLDVAGREIDAAWIDEYGASRSNHYLVPNTNQCKGCHRIDGEMRLLGLKARHVNRDFPFADGAENQLAHLARVGALTEAPDPADAPRAAVWDDPATGSVEQRARAWLEINCAHCHHAGAPAQNTGLDLMANQTDPVQYGVHKPPVAAGYGSGGLSYDIVPGEPDASILVYRIGSTHPGIMMPELGKRMVHDEGVALVREWIAGMGGGRQ